MIKSLILVAFSLFLLPSPAQEATGKLSPAKQLLKLMKFEESIIKGGEEGFPAVAQSLAPQNLNEKQMAEVKDAFIAYMRKIAADQDLKSKTIDLYEETFTNDELLEMIEFYKTPLGQKTLHALPKITGKATIFSQQVAQKYAGSFQEALTGILARKAAEEEKEGQ